MNVYINRNSKKEAWEHITKGEDGEYYFELYDADAFRLIENVSANTDVPKIVYETTLVDNDFPL